MARLVTDIKGIKETINKINNSSIDVQKSADNIISAAAVDMVTMAKKLAPVNDGALRNSITWKKLAILSYEVSANIFYAPYVEFGTKTYVSVPQEFTDIANKARQQKSKGDFNDLLLAIAKWIKNKGIGVVTKTSKTGKVTKSKKGTEKSQLGLAWVIAYNIVKKGIRPNPYFYPAYKYATSKMIKELTNKFK